MPVKNIAKDKLQKYDILRRDKEPYIPTYQVLAEYVHGRSANFHGNTQTPGYLLVENIYDNTARQANNLMAASLGGAMWPNGGKTAILDPPDHIKGTEAETQELRDFYEFATKVTLRAINHPKGGFTTAFEEYLLANGSYGTAGLGVYEADDYDAPFRFMAHDVVHMVIDEDPHGMVDTVYFTREMTLRQMVKEYGVENLSPAARQKHNAQEWNEKMRVLICIEPREERDYTKAGNQDMPIASYHIDMDGQHVLRESGYIEMPVFVGRFWKVPGEKYGRSPGMAALPDILELNAMREAYILGQEKTLDPPMALYEDSSLGNGVLDTSAGAVNVFSPTGRGAATGAGKAVEPLYTVGELPTAKERIMELTENVRNHFFVDRLLDLNNETRMTLGEANIRNELRGQSLTPVYSRQETEVLIRVMERVFNSLLLRGYYGVIPGSKQEQVMLARGQTPRHLPEAVIELMASDREVYQINFISPAARTMRSEELFGTQRTLEFATALAQIDPQVVDKLDTDAMLERVQELTGAPSSVIVAIDAVAKIREARAQAQAQQAATELERSQSETTRNVAQAQNMLAG